MVRCTARRLAVVAAVAVVAARVASPAATQAPTAVAGGGSSFASPAPTVPPPAATAKPESTAGRDQSLSTWSYGGATGPATWHTLNTAYERCDTGDSQSPVNVLPIGADVDAVGTTIETLVQEAGNTTLTTTRVANNVIFSCTDGCGRLSWSGRTYALAGIALHAAAEHPVNGALHSIEAQFAYTAPSGAAVRLAVVFSLAVDPHPLVDKLVEAIEANADGGRITLTPADFATMLVPESGFCTWMGSLTTPPCTEGIRWFLQTTILGVTRTQVAAFSAARGGGSNARPVQPSGNATRVTGCYGPPPSTPLPTPPPAPAPGAEDGSGAGRDDNEEDNSLCFPAAATVVTATGKVIPLSDLQSGESVAVAVMDSAGGGRPSISTSSPVFMWSHRTAGGYHPFVRLTTARHGSLTLSAGHLVYVGGVAVPAGSVSVGDVLAAVANPLAVDPTCAATLPTTKAAAKCGVFASAGGLVPAPVTRVTRVYAAGLYHPHTVIGEPLVDGFHVSAMTTAVGGGRSATAALGVAARVYGLVGWAWRGLEVGEWARGAGASVLAALG
ncbi:hypothetical protein MMPV_000633 [Pyropia vietnamensis]